MRSHKETQLLDAVGKYVILIVIMAALFTCMSQVAKGEPLYGQDYLGACSKHFNVEKIPQFVPSNAPFGSLYHTFSDNIDNITILLSKLHPTYYRVHLINATCIRNGNCGPYEIGHGYNKASFDKAVRNRNSKILNYIREGSLLYKRVADSYPRTTFIISPALEHDLSKEAWRILADETLRMFPQAILSNCADGGVSVERYKGAWIERHGTSNIRGADIISTDGADITDANIEAFKRDSYNAKVVFAWTRSYNLRTQSPTWTDPRARTSAPTNETLEMVAHIFDDRGAVPRLTARQCIKKIKFEAPWIEKPLAEDGNNKDPRANLPVAITAFNRSELQVLTFDGKVVGKLALYGKYNSSLYRHYSGYKTGSAISGYEFEKRAKVASGFPYTWLQSGNQCSGPVQFGKRQGAYR